MDQTSDCYSYPEIVNLFMYVHAHVYVFRIFLFRSVGFQKHLKCEFALNMYFWRWNKSVRCFNSSDGPIEFWFGCGWNCHGCRHASWTTSSALYILYSISSGSFSIIFHRKPSFYFSAVFSRQWTKAVCWGVWTPFTSSVWWGCYSSSRLFIWWFLIMKTL